MVNHKNVDPVYNRVSKEAYSCESNKNFKDAAEILVLPFLRLYVYGYRAR